MFIRWFLASCIQGIQGIRFNSFTATQKRDRVLRGILLVAFSLILLSNLLLAGTYLFGPYPWMSLFYLAVVCIHAFLILLNASAWRRLDRARWGRADSEDRLAESKRRLELAIQAEIDRINRLHQTHLNRGHADQPKETK